MNKLIGVYKIESISNPNLFYIGSSIDIKHRWGMHLYDLYRGLCSSPKLQAHYNRYGSIDLLFSVITYCSREDILQTEQFYINTLSPTFNGSSRATSSIKNTPISK